MLQNSLEFKQKVAVMLLLDLGKSKGFQLKEGDHAFYRLFIDGKNSGIRTKISHGEKEIHDGLLGQMAKDTKLAKREFLDLVDCPMMHGQYLAILRERGHVG